MKKFVIINDNMLGCVDERSPRDAQILASSVIRGASFVPLDGMYPISFNRSIRPATKADFTIFGVSPKGYEADPDCDFPTK
jgi:hypothetical protein